MGVVWIYLSGPLVAAASTNAAEVVYAYQIGASSAYSVVKGWFQYALISPLVLLGLAYSKGIGKRIEFYPLVFSALMLSFVGGFILNGAATEYPYIFNTIACLVAGSGLTRLYEKIQPKRKSGKAGQPSGG